MFGTLYVPAKEREALSFGIGEYADPHTVKGELVDPLFKAAAHLKPLWPKARATLPPIPVAGRKRA